MKAHAQPEQSLFSLMFRNSLVPMWSYGPQKVKPGCRQRETHMSCCRINDDKNFTIQPAPNRGRTRGGTVIT